MHLTTTELSHVEDGTSTGESDNGDDGGGRIQRPGTRDLIFGMSNADYIGREISEGWDRTELDENRRALCNCGGLHICWRSEVSIRWASDKARATD